MHYICKRLLQDVTYCPVTITKPFLETEYKILLEFSEKLPRISVPIKTEVQLIREQWVEIKQTIMSTEVDARLKKSTLFAAAKLLMTAYYEHDHDIPLLHAKWLSIVLDELCPVNVLNQNPNIIDANHCYCCINVILSCMLFLYLIFK